MMEVKSLKLSLVSFPIEDGKLVKNRGKKSLLKSTVT